MYGVSSRGEPPSGSTAGEARAKAVAARIASHSSPSPSPRLAPIAARASSSRVQFNCSQSVINGPQLVGIASKLRSAPPLALGRFASTIRRAAISIAKHLIAASLMASA
eukprot:scaffold55567_cov28-Tisochrysis_lutea.AAC.6